MSRELSEDEDEEETVKVKSIKPKGKKAAASVLLSCMDAKLTYSAEEAIERGPAKELVFSDSEEEADVCKQYVLFGCC